LRTTEGKPLAIPGVVISLFQGDKVLASQASGIDGSYLFTGLPKAVPLRLEFALAGYRRFPTVRSFTIDRASLSLPDVRLLNDADTKERSEIACRLRESLDAGASRSQELALLSEFDLGDEEVLNIMASFDPPAFGNARRNFRAPVDVADRIAA